MMKRTLILASLLFLSHSALYAQAPSIEWQKCLGSHWQDQGKYVQATSDGGFIMTGIVEGADGDVVGYHGNNGIGDAWVVKMDSKGIVQWSVSLGGASHDEASVVREAPDGTFVVGGTVVSVAGDGNVTLPAKGGADLWLVRLSATGQVLWQTRAGGEKNDYGRDFQFTPDGGFIMVGNTESVGGDVSGNHGSTDAWIVKLSSAGVVEWQKCLGGSGDEDARSVQVFADGYVVSGFVGSSNGNVPGFHGGPYDLLSARVDLSGNLVWAKALGGSGQDYGIGMAKTADGAVLISGETSSFDGDVSGNHGGGDFWAIKLDEHSGALLWQRCYGGSFNESDPGVAATPDGGFILAGSTGSKDGQVTCKNPATYTDGWVVRITPGGDLVWQKTISGGYYDAEHSVNPTPDGGVIVCGVTLLSNLSTYHKDLDPSGSSGDLYLAKLGAGATLPPTIHIALPPANICSGQTLTLTATATGIPPGATYKWFRNGNEVNGNDANVNALTYTAADFSNNEQVYCQLITSDGCGPVMYPSNTIFLSVSTLKAPTVAISGSAAAVCAGSPLTFAAAVTGGSSGPVYGWTVNGNPVGAGGPTYGSTGFVNGDLVTCTYSDNTACFVTTPIVSNSIAAPIIPIVVPSVGIDASATTVCEGTLVRFAATPVNGGTAPGYSWLINGVSTGMSGPAYASNRLTSGDVVSCILTSNAVCSTPVSATSNAFAITVKPKVPTTVRIDYPEPVCKGLPVVFRTRTTNFVSPAYEWNLNGVAVGSESTYTTSTLADGDVLIVRAVETSLQSCSQSSVIGVVPAVHEVPAVGAVNALITSLGQSTTLRLPVTGDIGTYSWSPAESLDDAAAVTPLATPVRSTIYTLTVTSQGGCTATGTITVKVVSSVTLPSAFSPNGDGHNDIFYVVGGPLKSVLKDFVVIDRWGRCVFQVHGVPPDDPAYGWDGRVGGSPASGGTYVYEIRMGLADGSQQVFKGTLLLVR